ncbi:hypothetical protein HY346_00030 [Candidatus Microgenomates bacterium]|nr:hypothetical protein [Candidatus Microgenomates bacterium]
MIVPTLVFIMIFFTAAVLALATFSINHYARLNTNLRSTSTLLAAEAGAEQTLYQLNQNSNFTGYATEQEFFSSNERGRATYQTTVTAGSIGNEKLITATARLYQSPSDTVPGITRKVRLTVVGTTPDNYSVQTGPGGLIMTNSATIANGDVRVNGQISMVNNARIGSPVNPVNVYVAHYNCPAGGASYPSLCAGGQPISIVNSAHIYGEVRATHQTNDDGMSNPGLIAGSTADPVALPGYDRSAQVAAVARTLSNTQTGCSQNQSRTWAANTKIIGDVDVSNNCQVTVTGNIWITGRLSITNSAKFKVANSAAAMPTIMVDGDKVDIVNNAAIIANTQGIGFRFVTFRSAASCSPDCNEVTGTDLYNSRNLQTINVANGALAAGSIFHARWSKLKIDNNGSIGQVIGQTIELANAGNISFGTQLSSGQTIWSIKNYQQLFD